MMRKKRSSATPWRAQQQSQTDAQARESNKGHQAPPSGGICDRRLCTAIARSAETEVRLAPSSGEAQQHHEQVDKVEVERQCGDHRLATRGGFIIRAVVHRLDSLGVVSGQAGKHADTYD